MRRVFSISKSFWFTALLVCLTSLAQARTGEESRALDQYIRNLGQLEQPAVSGYKVVSSEDKTIAGYECKAETYKGFPGFNEFLFSRSNVDVMYPGALLSGKSVLNKTYALSAVRPGPRTITVNLPGSAEQITQRIENPSFSTVQTALNRLLAQQNEADVGAEISWNIQNIYSKAHLKASLGVDANVEQFLKAKQNFGMNFSGDLQYAILKFNQKYFDVVIDSPRRPSDYIAEDFDTAEVQAGFEGSSPIYVASVSYGRYVLFVFESADLSLDLEQEISASLSVPVEGVKLGVGGSGKLDAGFKAGTLRTRGYILGGSAEEAAKSVSSMEGVVNFINSGGRFSKDSPGRPISYSLKYLSNGYPVEIVEETAFTKVECSEIYEQYRVKAISFELERRRPIALGQIDLWGKIFAQSGGAKAAGKPQDLWAMGWNIGRYPIKVGQTKKIQTERDVSFGKLAPADLRRSYIDLHFNIKGGWGGIFEDFYPKEKRIPLDEIKGNKFKESVETQFHQLEIEFQIEGIP